MNVRLKQFGGLFSVAALALSLAIPVFAQGGPPPGGGPGGPGGPKQDLGQGARGRITAVSATSITVQGRGGDPKTFTVSSATTVTLDGKASTADALKTGEFAAVTSTDSTSAAAIDARSHMGRHRGPGGPGGGPGGPGGGAPPAGGTAPTT